MNEPIEALREVVFEAIRIIQLLDDRTLDTGDGETVDLLQVIERWDGVLDSVDASRAMNAPRLRRELSAAYEQGRGDEREQWAPLSAAAEVLVSMCEVHGDFRNGVTDTTGTIDEGDVRAGEIIRAAREAIDAANRKSA